MAVHGWIPRKYCGKSRIPPILGPDSVSNRNDGPIAILIGAIIFLALGYVCHPLWIGGSVIGTPALGT